MSLGLLDRALVEVERNYLSTDLPQGETFELRSDLTLEEKAEILRTIAQIRHRLCRFREAFHLEPHRRGVRRLLRGYLAHFWAVLSECRASKLRGYGEVAPQVPPLLDPGIEALLSLVECVGRAVERRA